MILLQNLVICLLQSDKPNNTEHILMVDKRFFVYTFKLYLCFWYKNVFYLY